MPDAEDSAETTEPLAGLRFAYVAGVTPGKWIRRWEERMPNFPLHSFMSDDAAQVSVLRDGSADLSFVRLPVDREGLNVIPLYEEQPVVVAPKGHEISVFEEVALDDLAEENFLDIDEMGGPDMALQVVASGAGLAILPMSVARHLNVKDTVMRRLTGAPGDADRPGLAGWNRQPGDRRVHRNSARADSPEFAPTSAQQEKPKKEPSLIVVAVAPGSPRLRSATPPRTRTKVAARVHARRANADYSPWMALCCCSERLR